mmetsp:Transcript_30634/g.46395  ORF Transcript_30634/g.46395 Transcript_30634/m.46395 type:complete len:92 (+) Transcript_30634:238-513(+)
MMDTFETFCNDHDCKKLIKPAASLGSLRGYQGAPRRCRLLCWEYADKASSGVTTTVTCLSMVAIVHFGNVLLLPVWRISKAHTALCRGEKT